MENENQGLPQRKYVYLNSFGFLSEWYNFMTQAATFGEKQVIVIFVTDIVIAI